jgi:hypothetical protein
MVAEGELFLLFFSRLSIIPHHNCFAALLNRYDKPQNRNAKSHFFRFLNKKEADGEIIAIINHPRSSSIIESNLQGIIVTLLSYSPAISTS